MTTFDTARGRTEAEGLDPDTLRYRIHDITHRTLPQAIEADAAEGTTVRQDWYRAELQVLRHEAEVRASARAKADEDARMDYLRKEASRHGPRSH